MTKKIKKPKTDTKDAKIAELTDLLQRMQADFDNYKKHIEKQAAQSRNRAYGETILKLLPILDSFELALQNSEKHESFVKGIELIYSQLFTLLEQNGLRPIITENQKLDPFKHEVLMQEDSKEPEGTILEELQKGYMLNEMVLRTSKVKVSKQHVKKADNNK